MDANYKAYDHVASFDRIDGYLQASSGNYDEGKELPDRDKLTYSNGFYAMCSAVFVDIRDSSQMPKKYKRPALAKLYRAFISEVVAVLNSQPKAREINIVGDCVWAVFNTPYKSDIDSVFSRIAEVNSLVKVIDYKIRKAGYDGGIRAGVGASYGRALMIKAGYNGSGLNDVVYMGDVVNHAAKLAATGSAGLFSPTTYMGNDFATNLNDHNASLVARDWSNDCCTTSVINTAMEAWYVENCK